MKWIAAPKKPKDRECYVKSRFLWCPLQIGSEVRWLRFATIRYMCCYTGQKTIFGDSMYVWIAVAFED